MSSFPILDLVVGMIFVFFLLSIISSSAIEIILTGLKARATLLKEWLCKIFDKTMTQPDGTNIKLGQAIMDHCSVTALSTQGKSTTYIDARNFTSALLEKITFAVEPKNVAKNIDELIDAINKSALLSTEFQRVLLTYAYEAKDTYEKLEKKTATELELFRGKIETWYNSSMDRLTDALKKRYSRPFTFLVAVAITILLNADSVALAKYLYNNPEARAKFATEAYDATKDTALIKEVQHMQIKPDTAAGNMLTADEIKSNITKKINEIDKVKQGLAGVMPLTWRPGELKDANGKFSKLLLFSKITGLLATILAIMMGAPFWFDILNKISNLRSAGAKPAVSGDDNKK